MIKTFVPNWFNRFWVKIWFNRIWSRHWKKSNPIGHSEGKDFLVEFFGAIYFESKFQVIKIGLSFWYQNDFVLKKLSVQMVFLNNLILWLRKTFSLSFRVKLEELSPSVQLANEKLAVRYRHTMQLSVVISVVRARKVLS